MRSRAHAGGVPLIAPLDESVLARLAGEVGDGAAAVLVASRYRQLLGHRVRRVTAALRRPDVECALDALLSLKVSSSTVGARELADLAGAVEAAVRRHDVSTARQHAGLLWPAAVRADQALGCYLGVGSSSGPLEAAVGARGQSSSTIR